MYPVNCDCKNRRNQIYLFRLLHLLIATFLLCLLGCVFLDNSPPKYIYEAWEKPEAKYIEIQKDMRLCGYKDVLLANDISSEDVNMAEDCMKNKGYTLNTDSYRANNCYGQNSPYLCNQLWGNKKPQFTIIRSKLK